MVCRATPGMNVPMGLAHLDSGLDDDQVQSLMHRLRHEWAEQHPPEGGHQSRPGGGIAAPAGDVEHWTRFRDRLIAEVNRRPTLRLQRRAGMVARLEAADQPPSADMLWAAERIRDRAVRAARLLDDHLVSEAARIGVPDVEAFAAYSAGRQNAPQGRQGRASDEQQQRWPDLPLDPRTRHGLTALAEQPDNVDGRRDLIVDHSAPATTSHRIVGVGYHADSERLEILTRDGALLAYRNVDADTVTALNNDPDNVLETRLAGNPSHQYRDAVQSVAAGVRRRCSECGQFTGATHNCTGARSAVLPADTAEIEPAAPELSNSAVATATAGAIATRPATDSLLPHAPNRATFAYSADPARFAADVRATMNAPYTDQVPLLAGDSEPAMYGFGAQREFGVELEFDAGTYGAESGVGGELYDQGFIRQSYQVGYHSAAHSHQGYSRDVHSGWSYEQDGSVAGELVSPVLHDAPETWERIDRACRIMADSGAIASSGTGSHVSVSAADLAGSPVRLTRFLRMMYHHQGDLHTMSAAGYGRGSGYAHPLEPIPVTGFTRIGNPNRYEAGSARSAIDRYRFVNIAHIRSQSSHPNAGASRVEFRLWDGSLHTGRIQAQVKMSAALLDYSVNYRAMTLDSSQRADTAHLNPDSADFAEHTAQVRDLIDNLFRRDVDKRQAAALWAAGLAARRGFRPALT